MLKPFFNDYQQKLGFNGASIYGKYRVYSNDGVHNHFRVAVFAKTAFNNTAISQPAVDLAGYNSGVEGGVVATKLIEKSALSAGTSFMRSFDNLYGNNL